MVYCACIRSVLEYCGPLFVNLAKYPSDLIDNIQDRCHRIICGSASGCQCSLFVPLNYRRTILGWNLFQKILSNEEHSIHGLLYPRLPHTNNFRFPISSNCLLQHSFVYCMSKLFNSKVCLMVILFFSFAFTLSCVTV